jgi:diacylglycerol kinase (ATP)
MTERLQSFRYAFRGVRIILQTQQNAWIHAAATVAVVGLGLSLGLSAGEWCWLVLAMMAVWAAEALNTALELLADVAAPEFHPLVEKAKDVAAGAVLISALGALVIGILILVPKVIAKLP